MTRPTAARRLVASVVAVAAVATACGAPGPTSGPTVMPSATAPGPTAATPPAEPAPSTASGSPSVAPRGTAWVDVASAGIRLPVPHGWELVSPEGLADPSRRAELEARFPGAGALLAQVDRLGERAKPVFFAVDPSASSPAGPIPTDISVMATEPSVGGLLLDLVAGFIAAGVQETVGAATSTRERVRLPAGEAVRIEAHSAGDPGAEGTTAVAWVIGAPGHTLLVSILGGDEAVAAIDPDAIAAGIVPLGSAP